MLLLLLWLLPAVAVAAVRVVAADSAYRMLLFLASLLLLLLLLLLWLLPTVAAASVGAASALCRLWRSAGALKTAQPSGASSALRSWGESNFSYLPRVNASFPHLGQIIDFHLMI